jgi:hypothetical protein
MTLYEAKVEVLTNRLRHDPGTVSFSITPTRAGAAVRLHRRIRKVGAHGRTRQVLESSKDANSFSIALCMALEDVCSRMSP